jgi:hypothetical protein
LARGRPTPQRRAAGSFGHRLQVSEQPEPLQVNRQSRRLSGQIEGHQQFDAILVDDLIAGSVSAAGNVGIDRYLGKRTPSRGDTDQVDRGASTFLLDVRPGLVADSYLHNESSKIALW